MHGNSGNVIKAAHACRGALYVESPEGREWGWYNPQQIPSLIAWLETGSKEEQQLAEDIYAMYQPVLKIVMHPKQVGYCLAVLVIRQTSLRHKRTAC